MALMVPKRLTTGVSARFRFISLCIGGCGASWLIAATASPHNGHMHIQRAMALHS